jgi:PAS domain S-box-containing protein
MNEKKEILKNILKNPSSILEINNFYSREMQYWEDEDKNILSISHGCEKITGYSQDDFLKNPKLIEEIIFSQDIEIWKKRCKDVHKQDIEGIQFRIHHKSGNIVYIKHDSQKLYSSNGQFIGLRSSNRNITKQKLTDEIINSSSTVLFLWKNEDGYPAEFVSENVINLLGYSYTDFINGTINYNELIHPDCKARVNTEIKKNISQKSVKFQHQPYRIITKENKIKWVSDNTGVKLDPDGKITHFHGIVSDITEAKNTLDNLQKSEEIYRNVFNHSPLGILHFDSESNITDCNNEFARMLEVPRESLIGLNLLSSIKDEKFKNAIRDALKTGSGYYDDIYTSVISGKSANTIIRFNAIYSLDKKKIIGGLGLVEDVTIRRKNERMQKALYDISEEASSTTSMKELYSKLHKIIQTLMPADNMYVAMYNTKTDTISFPYHIDKYDLLPMTQKFGNGLTEYILRTKKSKIITADMDRELQKMGEVELSGEFSQVWVGVYLEFEGDYQGVLTVQDYENVNAYSIEELKILQFVSEQIVKVLNKKYADRRLRDSVRELSEAKKELEIINDNKDRFFSIIAHDLRAPFNTLLGVTSLISDEMDKMSEDEVKEISSIIHSSTNNLFKLIENLLNWSRLQMGSFQVNPEVVSISEAFTETLEIVKHSAVNKNITIENKISNYEVLVDRECLNTVLRNLLSNAIKFTFRNGDVVLTSEQVGANIQISVEDNGVGMDEEVTSKLFSITSKTSTVGTENEKGTGLGLILCQDLIEKNNGKIWVESESGKGSKFSFILPKS